jgi:poly-gamma-glutamate biosynthesis protein PgsC/CapC
MLTAALIIGVVVSLLLTETIGLTAGGIVVPGYVALMLDRPGALVGFLVVSLASYGIVQLLRTRLILFGSRRFAITILIGLTLSVAAEWLSASVDMQPLEWAGLGFVVPGLLAHQFDRQGIVPTIAVLAIAGPVTRLLTVLAVWI